MNINELFDNVFADNGNLQLNSNNAVSMNLLSENPSISPSDGFDAHCSENEELEHRPITREIMSKYLLTRCHRRVTILHSKVAQKSYGSEKRFEILNKTKVIKFSFP